MNPTFFRRIALAIFTTLLIVSLTPAFAQSSGSSLTGRVLDDSGAALPGVTITATNTETGFNRVVVTGSDGSYRFSSLPIGTYDVTAELSGFSTVKTSKVQLQVATERNIPITLKTAAVSQEITVTAEAPLVATTPAIGTVVSQQELEGLPLNGRQFANLATLAPGTTLSVNSDPTKPGQLTIALNGGSGRNVNFVIDGGDNTDDTIGGALQNFNLEAVQEFKIQTMQYKAEYGRSSGGVLSVVTKTGTNDFAGSLYEFARRDNFYTSKTQTEIRSGASKQAYKRDQYGASFGGPIIRDRAHFFGTYEKTKRNTSYTVDTSGVFPAFDGKSFPIPFIDELGTAKASINLSPKQFLSVRYGYQKNADKYGANSLYLPSALGTVSNKYKSILGNHTWQLGPSALNEFVYQWTRFNNAITADSNDPALLFPSGVTTGQNGNTPQTTNQEKSQFKDDLSWSSTLFGSRHEFKTGVNYIHEPILGGDFSTGLNGVFTLLKDEPNSPVSEISIFGGFFGNKTPVDEYSVYLQDDWSASQRLTVNVGARYDLWTGFDLDQRSNPAYQDFAAAADTHKFDYLPWLKKFADGQGAKGKNDKNNFGPRLGFTYDLTGSGRRLLRGGVGRYYDFPYTNATILFPAAAVQSTYGAIYSFVDPTGTGIRNADGTFYRPGQPLPPNQLGSPDIPIPNNVLSPRTQATPYSDQASIGYSWEVTSSLGVNIDAVSTRYRDIPYRFRANPIVDTNGSGVLGDTVGGVKDKRLFPRLSANTRLWVGNGRAKYTGLNLGFHARVLNRIETQGFYTLSKATGNVLVGADEFRFWDSSLQPGVQTNASVTPYDPQSSTAFGNLYTDARHRVTLSALYNAPLGINVSGILRYHSATPYTEFAGSDINHDGYRMDLAPGVKHPNTLRGDSFSQIDLRLSKAFKFGGNYGFELIGEVFNVLNEENATAFNGTRTSANFKKPSSFAGDAGQGEQRLGQLGLRVTF